MTPAQTEFLRKLIDADRSYRSRKANGDHMAHHHERGVEVGGPFGTDMRTVRVFEDAGLIEVVNLHGGRSAHAFLGKYTEIDLED